MVLDSTSNIWKESIIIGIDVGIINLGFVVCKVNSQFKIHEIIEFNRIDLRSHIHRRISRNQCELYHSSSLCDKLLHFFQEYKEYFDNADKIIIERQPLQGFVVIEQLVFREFRDKAVLISPNSMHKFLNINNLEYEERKEKTLEIAKKYFNEEQLIKIEKMERAHDISDAICIILFYIYKIKSEYEKNERLIRIEKRLSDYKNQTRVMGIDFSKFHFKRT